MTNGLNLEVERPGTKTEDTFEFEQTIRATLDEVKNFDSNPRFLDNEEYERLRNSLKASNGLKASLEVCKRPNESHFTTYRGGGTRLMLLRELYEETNDQAYFSLKLVILPYPGEAQLIANHLGENLNRGNLTLLETAIGILDFKEKLEMEKGSELSNSAFARLSTEMGSPVVRQRLSLYHFVSDLYQLLPNALSAGIGRPLVEDIQQLKKALDAVGTYFGDTDLAETVWLTVLPDIDNGDITAEFLENALIQCISEQKKLDSGDVYGLFSRALRGEPLVQPPVESNTKPPIKATTQTSSVKFIPDLLKDCVQFDEDSHILTVNPPSAPLDSGSPEYAKSCLCWHLMSTLQTQKAVKTPGVAPETIGQLTQDVLENLSPDELVSLFEGYIKLHKRLNSKS